MEVDFLAALISVDWSQASILRQYDYYY
jgi:hypothetical protein